MKRAACPFCELPPSRIVAGNDLAAVIRDGFPVSPGHTRIIPRRHIGSFFDASDVERAALVRLLAEARLVLDAEFQPAGYNISINDGRAVGTWRPWCAVTRRSRQR